MNSRSKAGAGFTIVETMIFLAVSGLMFVLAISAMSGKQQQTEFQTGLDTLRAQLDLEMNNVATGNYPTLSSTFACSADDTKGDPPTEAAGTEGTCEILGDAISFQVNPSDTSESEYTISPIFARTYVASHTLNVSASLADAVPTIFTDTASTQVMPFGLSIAPISSPPPNTIYPGGLGAFGMTSFTSFSGNSKAYSGTNLNSGASHVEIFAIPGSQYTVPLTSINVTDDPAICGPGDLVCNGPSGSNPETIDPTGGITFCVDSGTTHESALFTVGGSSDPSSATYQIITGSDICG